MRIWFAVVALLVGGSSVARADSWTILTYIAGDNDLERFAAQNVIEMTKVGSSANLKIVVQLDRGLKHSQDAIPGVANFAGTRRFLVNKDAVQQVQDLGDPDGTQAATIADFIDWGIRTYPADHYALVMWDHGGGWTGANQDETGGRGLTPLPDLTAGISMGLSRAGRAKLELIGWDECLMATVEVAAALAPYADVLVASEELEPGEGWDYEKWLGAIVANPAIDTVSVGKAIADGFSANVGRQSKSASFTLSVVQLSQVPALVTAVGQLADGIKPLAMQRDTWINLAKARHASDGFGRKGQEDSTGLIDLGMFADGAAQNVASLKPLTDGVKTALGAAVVYKVGGPAHANATGLSIYLPQRTFNNDYQNAASSPSWGVIAAAYSLVSASDTVGPAMSMMAMTTTSSLRTASVPEGGITVNVSLSDSDVADVAFVVARTNSDGQRDLVGALPHALPAADGLLSRTWDGTWPVLSDGQKETELAFYPIESYDDNGRAMVLLSAPAEIDDDGSYSPVVLLFAYDLAAQTGIFLAAYEESETGGAGEIPVGAATDKVRPMRVKIKDQGDYERVPGTEELNASTLSLVVRATKADQRYSIGFTATDYAGNDTTLLLDTGAATSHSGCAMSGPSASGGWGLGVLIFLVLVLRLRRGVSPFVAP